MRLIDADALKKSMGEECEGACYCCKYCEGEDNAVSCGLIKRAPTIAAKSAIHAYWKSFIHSAYHGCDEDGEPIFRDVLVHHCSNCDRSTVIKEKYCPNCGARMDLEEKQC